MSGAWPCSDFGQREYCVDVSLIKLSLIKELVVGGDSGLIGLYIKDSLSGESFAISGN